MLFYINFYKEENKRLKDNFILILHVYSINLWMSENSLIILNSRNFIWLLFFKFYTPSLLSVFLWNRNRKCLHIDAHFAPASKNATIASYAQKGWTKRRVNMLSNNLICMEFVSAKKYHGSTSLNWHQLYAMNLNVSKFSHLREFPWTL